MSFDWTISLSNLLLAISMLAAVFGFIFGVRSDVRLLGSKMDHIEKSMDRFGDVLVAIARQDERLNAIETRVNTLSSDD